MLTFFVKRSCASSPPSGPLFKHGFSKGCAVEGDIILDVAVTGDGDTFLFVPAFVGPSHVLAVFLLNFGTSICLTWRCLFYRDANKTRSSYYNAKHLSKFLDYYFVHS